MNYVNEIEKIWPSNRFGELHVAENNIQTIGKNNISRLEYVKDDYLYGGFDIYSSGRTAFIFFYNSSFSQKISGILNLNNPNDIKNLKNIICELPYD